MGCFMARDLHLRERMGTLASRYRTEATTDAPPTESRIRLRAMTRSTILLAIVLTAPSILSATDLTYQTSKAWDEYIQAGNSQMQQRIAGNSPFLWIDEAPGRRERVRQGEIVAEPVQKDNPEKVPHGLIHHWIGAVFIPNATINTVSGVLNDYDRYNQFYGPAVIGAKLIEDAKQKRRFSMVLATKEAMVTTAIESEYNSQSRCIDDRHCYAVICSTRIQQIEDYGHSGEHKLPPDEGAGYVWRLCSVERLEERDGGVYAEFEVMALSRDIPFEFQWLVKPILQRLPRNAMIAMLQRTRDAVHADDRPPVFDAAGLRQSPMAANSVNSGRSARSSKRVAGPSALTAAVTGNPAWR